MIRSDAETTLLPGHSGIRRRRRRTDRSPPFQRFLRGTFLPFFLALESAMANPAVRRETAFESRQQSWFA